MCFVDCRNQAQEVSRMLRHHPWMVKLNMLIMMLLEWVMRIRRQMHIALEGQHLDSVLDPSQCNIQARISGRKTEASGFLTFSTDRSQEETSPCRMC